jgi:hypothetical protein
VKSYFKNLINNAVNKNYKSKLLRNTSFNSIGINMFYQRDTMVIGIALMVKAVGVDFVYE